MKYLLDFVVLLHVYIPNCKMRWDFVHQMEATVLMALLQPAPETFLTRDMVIAKTLGHFILLVVFLLGGFIIPKGMY